MKPPPRSAFSRQPPAVAEDLAAEILGYLAADPDRLCRFLDLTGLTPHAVRQAAAQTGFAVSLLDYLASDDRLLVAFAKEQGHDPAQIAAIRQRLVPVSDEGGG